MFISVDEVKSLTGYDVTNDEIKRAQAIIETFVGKTEIEVERPYDQMLLARATGYQAAYMKNNADKVFEQIAIKQLANSDGLITLDNDKYAPYIAPLAMLAIKNLSWKGSRSVRIGPLFERHDSTPWVRD
jgi:hypothetical protein